MRVLEYIFFNYNPLKPNILLWSVSVFRLSENSKTFEKRHLFSDISEQHINESNYFLDLKDSDQVLVMYRDVDTDTINEIYLHQIIIKHYNVSVSSKIIKT